MKSLAMIKNKLYSAPLFIFLLQGVLMISCCQSPCDDNRHIDKDQFSIFYPGYVPFSGIDTLLFLKNGTDTITYIGQGKNIYFQEVNRPDNDCSVKYRLLNHSITFKNKFNINDLYVHYYIYSETNAWRDFYEWQFSNIKIGPNEAFSSSRHTTTMQILGRTYQYIEGVTSNTNQDDSLYFNYNLDDEPEVHIVRIKNGMDIYEVIPH
jgi:hypothetical protein